MRRFEIVCVFSLAAIAQADEELDKAVADLSSDAVDVRDTAEKKLTAAGKDALDACQKALTAATDPEVRGRLTHIVDRIQEVIALGAPPKTPEEAFQRWMTADFTGDGKLFWSVLSKADRDERISHQKDESDTLATLSDVDLEKVARERYGVGAEEFRKMTPEQAAIASFSDHRPGHVGLHKLPEEWKTAKLAKVEIRDDKAFCVIQQPAHTNVEIRPYMVFVHEDGGWKLDSGESEVWALENRKKK